VNIRENSHAQVGHAEQDSAAGFCRTLEQERWQALADPLDWPPMSILPDWRIRELALGGMITPFEDRLIRTEHNASVISYGLSSFGYDLRCADEWKVFTNVMSAIVDPKNFDERSFVDIQAGEILIPPNSFVLARSLEYMKIPDNVMVVALGKSTYARCGVVANVTPLEPGWEGHVTLEFSNTTPLPAKMYAHEGCVQLLFFEGERPEVTYADRAGKYQGQRGVTLPKL
jgi:dCTP deaminase